MFLKVISLNLNLKAKQEFQLTTPSLHLLHEIINKYFIKSHVDEVTCRKIYISTNITNLFKLTCKFTDAVTHIIYVHSIDNKVYW